MLHSLKKSFAKATAPTRGMNPGGEFLDYKNRVHNVRKNLEHLDKRMDETLRSWSLIMMDQRQFSQKLSEGYPISGDHTDQVAAEFEEGVQKVYDYFVRNTSPEAAAYHQMHKQVKDYLMEIEGVESKYAALMEAKSESERYQAKIDTITRSKKNKDDKKSRNFDKLDEQKQKYTEQLESIVALQKTTYEKAPIVYKIALCAYWTAHEVHTKIMMQSMEKTSKFIQEASSELSSINISELKFELEEFSDALSTPDNIQNYPKVPSETPLSPSRSVQKVEETEKISDIEEDQTPVPA